MRIRLVLLCALAAATAHASPTIPLDDPVYERLAVLRAEGRLPLYLGGIRPLTEYDAQRLLLQAGEPEDPLLPSASLRGPWFNPLRRVNVRLGLFSDEERPYSTPDRPLGMIGGVELSCEHQEGRPCGQGGGAVFELDSAAGYGHWISAFTRLQFIAGSNQWEVHGALDRGYINGQVGPVALLIGRDVLALGPGVHTQLIWGDNPAPFDQIRVQTSHPLKIPRIPVTVSALYAVGRLRDPQTFHNTLVTLARLELAIADQLELGAQQLLQLGGDGAVQYGFGDFLAEHFTRTGNQMGAGASNRRDSLEAVYTNKWARGLRMYYELAFEDFRKHVADMFLYDCDHLVGFEMPALTATGRHGFVVELQHNGPFSQEHSYFTSGTTNAGRVVGAPLGPDSWSLYGQARIDLRRVSVYPWFEWARLSSDLYDAIEHGPVDVIMRRQPETRIRIGSNVRWWPFQNLRVDASAFYEDVEAYAFVTGARRGNGGAQILLDWVPQPR
jgi:capsule assembly protein Wzi